MLCPSTSNDQTASGPSSSDDIEVFFRPSVLCEMVRPARRCPKAEGGLDRFTLLDKLGQGATGTVHAAHDRRHNRSCALKILRWPQDPQHRQRLFREGRLTSAVRHPNVVRVHEIIDEPTRAALVMELLHGETVRQRMRRQEAAGRPLELDDALWIAIGVCRALAATHASGIVHRDVKPTNVMIGEDGQIKLLDFGIAKRCGDDDAPPESTGTYLHGPVTEPGAVIGTPGYMSPEQARGGPIDARTDVFSMGVVLYEMLAGQRPFAGESMFEMLLAVEGERPPPPSQCARDIEPRHSAALDSIVLRCLERDAASRYPHANELLSELLAFSRSAALEKAA